MPTRCKLFLWLIPFAWLLFPLSGATRYIPKTAVATIYNASPVKAKLLPDNINLTNFITSLKPGNSNLVIGVYVPGIMALPVTQQPNNQPGFVSSIDHQLTQFRLAMKYASYGLLAHNQLSGSLFPYLQLNQEVILVLGNRELKYFRIGNIERFQALSPDSPYSKFIDLSAPDQTISAADLFYRTYGISNRVIFQTCIEKNNQTSWGRLFITAVPIDASFYNYLAKFSTIN